MSCTIFQRNTDLLVIYQNINNFTQDTLHPSFILGKKIGVLHCKSFSKHPLFTTFSLFLKVSEVCNISNKCWFPNKSVNKIFLHKTPYTAQSCALDHRRFQKGRLFTTFLPNLIENEVCNISNKYRSWGSLKMHLFFFLKQLTVSVIKVFRSMHVLPCVY